MWRRYSSLLILIRLQQLSREDIHQSQYNKIERRYKPINCITRYREDNYSSLNSITRYKEDIHHSIV